jgi:hypothetical protein
LQFARFFARYGVATLAYDRRGVGASGGDYGSSTHEQTVRDARAALRAAAGHPMVEGERVGLFGTSAGAWTVQDVAGGPFEGDDVRPAFVMTFVGPAVSVEAQQRGTGRRIAEREGWGLERRRLIDRALELSCAADRAGDRRVFIELDALLAKGRAGGWIGEVFVDPAEPSSVPALDGLWVRRYAYDPADDLRRIGVPYLGVFGEDDFIVGWRESVSALERAFAGDRAELLTTVVVAGQGHSVEHGDTRRSLATDDGRGVIDYFKFDRVDARFMQAVAEFLVSRGFAAR